MMNMFIASDRAYSVLRASALDDIGVSGSDATRPSSARSRRGARQEPSVRGDLERDVLGRLHLPIFLAGDLRHRTPELAAVCLVGLAVDRDLADRRVDRQALERRDKLLGVGRLRLLDRRG